MLSLTIYLELLKQNIENPGMVRGERRDSIPIITYNCNGLRDKKKLKRLLIKIGLKVEKGAIVLLQETHLKDTNYFKMIWRHKFESNCKKTNSAGVMILYNNDYEITDKFYDEEGRNIIIAIEKDETKLIVSNAYFPNDHKEGIIFAEATYLKILEFQYKFPEHQTVFGGDFNVCMNENDSMNRISTKIEKGLSDVFANNNRITGLTDSYRSIHKDGGYSWKRGNIYSRLDYIFLSATLLAKVETASCDWAFESSDHAAVQVKLVIEKKPIKGPGIVKVNTNILDDPKIVQKIGEELDSMMQQTDQSWSPHLKLEFLKVSIRSIFSNTIGEVRKELYSEIAELEEETNQMENFKLDTLKSGESDITEKTQKIDTAINKLKATLLLKRNKMTDYRTFRSTAKWFEYGEKPNKFFLSLLKSRQNQKLISRIKCEEKEYLGQSEVMKGITSFYSNLYSKKDKLVKISDDFYKHCPKLNNEQAKLLDSDITLADLGKALKTCKNSSPGPDGIPYIVYRKFWKLTGPIILDAWKHSTETQSLPPSHYESIITLLPKEGKDISDIKNWRPITLSNCDSKIITKALSIKVSKVLESIIDDSQTAYVPGRSVADNLRTNFFLKQYCEEKNLDSVLISLDAKKAFDSVDHEYIEDTLRAYGFGKSFINTFKLLYKDITARILINGYQSESIKISRGVKQGDALSCAIFIICIDPLLRNLNQSKAINEIKVDKTNISFKAGAYADDVSVICKNNQESIQEVFNEYDRLTERSGLELNADKTEILKLSNHHKTTIRVKYRDANIEIGTVDKLKICGLYYCNNQEEEYQLNVAQKIDKLSYKIKKWIPRFLTIEGKILIVKTFGLSQLIYNMQSVHFKPLDIVRTEREIFKFIWSTNENQNGIDRISRAVMKNDYDKGGMKVTDVECLDKSLKLRQVIRANNSKHVIAKIQAFALGNRVDENYIKQEYHSITKKEAICSSAQETINFITDYNRKQNEELEENEYESDRNLINEVSSIHLETYLKRKKKVFSLCILRPITSYGISTLGELLQAYEHETNSNLNKSMLLIIKSFPKSLIEIARCYNDEINEITQSIEYIQTSKNRRTEINIITTKEIQVILKNALNKVEKMNFNNKLNIDDFDVSNIITFRNHVKNAKLRNIYFRLIHNDFFTHSRMKRYKMTDSDLCPRCKEVETTKHLLWECRHVQHIWKLFNEYMTKLGISEGKIQEYEQVYEAGRSAGVTTIKIKIIQQLIQIQRPANWDQNNLESLVSEIVKIDYYNFKASHQIPKFATKWNFLNN
jgi:exonuclease III